MEDNKVPPLAAFPHSDNIKTKYKDGKWTYEMKLTEEQNKSLEEDEKLNRTNIWADKKE